jgi:hypothetical protein
MNGFGDIIKCIKETDPSLFVNEFEHVREFVTVYMSKPQKPVVFNETLTKLCSQNPHIRRPIIAAMCRTSASPMSSGEVYIKSDDLMTRFWSALRSLELPDDVSDAIEQIALLCEEQSSLGETESCHVYNDDDFDLPSTSQVLDGGPSLREPSIEFVSDQRSSHLQQDSGVSSNKMGNYTLSQYDDDFEQSTNIYSPAPPMQTSTQPKGTSGADSSGDLDGYSYEDDFEQSSPTKTLPPQKTAAVPAVTTPVVGAPVTIAAHNAAPAAAPAPAPAPRPVHAPTSVPTLEAAAKRALAEAEAEATASTVSTPIHLAAATVPLAIKEKATNKPTDRPIEKAPEQATTPVVAATPITVAPAPVPSHPTRPSSAVSRTSLKAPAAAAPSVSELAPIKTPTKKTPASPVPSAVTPEGSSVIYDDDDFESSSKSISHPPVTANTKTEVETSAPTNAPPTRVSDSAATPGTGVALENSSSVCYDDDDFEAPTTTAPALKFAPVESTSQTYGLTTTKEKEIAANVANSTPFATPGDADEIEFPDLFELEESTESGISEVRYDDDEVGALTASTRGKRVLRRKTSIEKLMLELDPVEVVVSSVPKAASLGVDGGDSESIGRASPYSAGRTGGPSAGSRYEESLEGEVWVHEEGSDAHEFDMPTPITPADEGDAAFVMLEKTTEEACSDLANRLKHDDFDESKSRVLSSGMPASTHDADEYGDTDEYGDDFDESKSRVLSSVDYAGEEPEAADKVDVTDVVAIELLEHHPAEETREVSRWRGGDPGEKGVNADDFSDIENEDRQTGATATATTTEADYGPYSPVGHAPELSIDDVTPIAPEYHSSTASVEKEAAGTPVPVSRNNNTEGATAAAHNPSDSITYDDVFAQSTHHFHQSEGQPTSALVTRQRPKSAVVVTSSYDGTSSAERSMLRSSSATQKRLNAAQQYAYGEYTSVRLRLLMMVLIMLMCWSYSFGCSHTCSVSLTYRLMRRVLYSAADLESGYRLTRKPPVPVQAFQGCVKPDYSMTVEQMYNSTIKKPPLKPPLPHDALKTVVKKKTAPAFDESAVITDTKSFYMLTKKKADATTLMLEQLLGNWERILTTALREKLMDEEERHTMEVGAHTVMEKYVAPLLSVLNITLSNRTLC